MAPARPAKGIRVKVPRHNAQRINAKLSAEVRSHARTQKVLVDTAQPSSKLTQAIESASDWNSLLMTARAERGPQWDIGTQQFLVDKYSELYYDPTPLLEAVKKVIEDEQPEEPPQHHQHHQPPFQLQHNMSMSPRHHTPMRERDFGPPNVHPHSHPHPHPHMGVGGREQSPHRPLANVNYPYPSGSPAGMNMSMSMRGPSQGPVSYPGSSSVGPPFNSASSGQFMGESTNSPIRMGGGMGGIGGGMRGGMGVGGMGNVSTMGGGMGGSMGGNMGGNMGGGMGGGMGGVPGGMPGGMGGSMGIPGGMGGNMGNGMGNMGGMGGMGSMGNIGTMANMGVDHGNPMSGMGGGRIPLGVPMNIPF